jgi:hypothetical protein
MTFKRGELKQMSIGKFDMCPSYSLNIHAASADLLHRGSVSKAGHTHSHWPDASRQGGWSHQKNGVSSVATNSAVDYAWFFIHLESRVN